MRAGILLVALAIISAGSASCSLIPAGDPNAAHIAGPVTIDGPLVVHGAVEIAGPCVVHGPVKAAGVDVAGPVETLPGGELPGPSGQAYGNSLHVAGPLTVNGPLIADGRLKIAGKFISEGMARPEQVLLQQPVVPQPVQVYRPPPQITVSQPSSQSELELPPEVTPSQRQVHPLSGPAEVTE